MHHPPLLFSWRVGLHVEKFFFLLLSFFLEAMRAVQNGSRACWSCFFLSFLQLTYARFCGNLGTFGWSHPFFFKGRDLINLRKKKILLQLETFQKILPIFFFRGLFALSSLSANSFLVLIVILTHFFFGGGGSTFYCQNFAT